MNLHQSIVVFPILISLFSIAWCSNILAVFHHPGFSHFKSFLPILRGLAKNGHELTVVTYFPTKIPYPNYNEILLNGEYPLNSYDLSVIQPSTAFRKSWGEFYFLQKIGQEACEIFYKSKALDTIWKLHGASPFDLLIVEAFNTDCVLGIVHELEVPIIALSSCVLLPWYHDRALVPDFPSFVPAHFSGFSDEMSFLERLQNFLVTKGYKFLHRTTQMMDNYIIRKSLKVDVDVEDYAKNISLILVNQHYSIHGSRPLSNRMVEIGGAHIPREKSHLPKDIQQFLETSEHGVILLSWGSLVNVSSLPEDKLNGIINGLQKLKERVIWKWDSGKSPIVSDKFFMTKWLKQKDVLCHPKLRLFWSHGGLLGTSESVYCAVPMVVTPMYGDQYINAKAVEKRKMAEILNYEDITEDNVYNITTKVLDPEYKRNAVYVSDVFRNRQNHPLDTALWWIEHVLHTKGSNLTYSDSVNMGWFAYYSIDAIVLLLIVAFLISLCPIYCTYKVVGLIEKRYSPRCAELYEKKKTKTS